MRAGYIAPGSVACMKPEVPVSTGYTWSPGSGCIGAPGTGYIEARRIGYTEAPRTARIGSAQLCCKDVAQTHYFPHVGTGIGMSAAAKISPIGGIPSPSHHGDAIVAKRARRTAKRLWTRRQAVHCCAALWSSEADRRTCRRLGMCDAIFTGRRVGGWVNM